MKKSPQSKKRSKKLSKKRSRVSQKKRILDGGVDLEVIVKDDTLGGMGGRHVFPVNGDDSVQSILDKYKCKLVRNSKWPINENEYKYILRITDRILEFDQTISEAGISNESTVIINSQKIKHHEELYSKIEKLEKKVLELEAIHWLGYFGYPLDPYYYNDNYKNVTVDVIKSALTIINKKTGPHFVGYQLFQIMKYMNDENLEKLILFLIENDIGISTSTNILKFNDPNFSNKLKEFLEGWGDKVEVFNKIIRVMAKIHS